MQLYWGGYTFAQCCSTLFKSKQTDFMEMWFIVQKIYHEFMYIYVCMHMQIAHLTADDEAPLPLSLYSFIARSYCFLASSAFFSHSYTDTEHSGSVRFVKQKRQLPFICIKAVKLYCSLP